jgi:hypothetical protein
MRLGPHDDAGGYVSRRGKSQVSWPPNHSGGRDQEDRGSKPAPRNSSWDSKNPSQKKDWWNGSRCKPWVQTPVLREKKEEEKRTALKCPCPISSLTDLCCAWSREKDPMPNRYSASRTMIWKALYSLNYLVSGIVLWKQKIWRHQGIMYSD